MASFFEDLYNKLFSPSPSPFSTPYPSSDSFLLAVDDMAPHNLPQTTMDESAIVESVLGGNPVPGHFPSSPRSSMSSTISAQSDIASRLTTSAAAPRVKLDPMIRHYPKPTEEIDVEAMLARKPLKGTLSHYFKNARDVKIPVKTAAQQAKDFEDTKKELLRAKEEMQRLSTAKR
ncbi:hypothetical protein B0T16DRAFT_390999 [Cercophora newfieldiana]|uniref:Uncharacterized protein n=1 Tax=Cercophora newfieldiana TaxID=92897 RepID=A0AA40CPJ4_9PEZI|nr:hypothetical protein B0T16DRAFT_390999 [Cercophora newfieldiana]